MAQSMDVTSDDKLWALLAYLFSPIVPVIILLMEEKKNRPFIRAHNVQALVLGVLNLLVGFTAFLVFPLCINLAITIYLIYLAIQAYQGQYATIPLVTDFVKKQGWA